MLTSYPKNGTKQIPGNYKLFVIETSKIGSIFTNASGEIINLITDDLEKLKKLEFDIGKCSFENINTTSSTFNSQQTLSATFSGKSTTLINAINELEKLCACGISIIRVDNNGKAYLSGYSESVDNGYNRMIATYVTGRKGEEDVQNYKIDFLNTSVADEIPFSDDLSSDIKNETGYLFEDLPNPIVTLDLTKSKSQGITLHGNNGDQFTVDWMDGATSTVTCNTLSPLGGYTGTVNHNYIGLGKKSFILIKDGTTPYTSLKGISEISNQKGVNKYYNLSTLSSFNVFDNTPSGGPDLLSFPALPSNPFLKVGIHVALTNSKFSGDVNMQNLRGILVVDIKGLPNIIDGSEVQFPNVVDGDTDFITIKNTVIENEIDFSGIAGSIGFDISGNSSLKELNFNNNMRLEPGFNNDFSGNDIAGGEIFGGMPTQSDNDIRIDLSFNNMPSGEVDDVIINIEGKFTGNNGTLTIDGNSARTSASDTAYNALIARGWTINT